MKPIHALALALIACGPALAQSSFLSPDAKGRPARATLFQRGQNQTGGVHVTSFSIGTPASASTVTIDCGNAPLQFLTNNAAFTLKMAAFDGSCLLNITNGASPGTVTFSGFTVGASPGAPDTTSAHKFTVFLWEINGVSSYTVQALQ